MLHGIFIPQGDVHRPSLKMTQERIGPYTSRVGWDFRLTFYPAAVSQIVSCAGINPGRGRK